MIEIPFYKFHENAVLPDFATPGAGCVDLVATEIEQIREDFVTVKFGFATAIPEG